ncbi:hypothetical protein HU200_027742 [Digitaria exilis]|uniref:Bifunctional inhibitor/plant lipid transfer protein/seed storage helical domain-containing protein n=1 Tax=Digitaria exilis TaxID=1010633 RepID=A0A835EUF0_9POAL|nr:hypothetical protein HU200_027742 [Digitaria exilis]
MQENLISFASLCRPKPRMHPCCAGRSDMKCICGILNPRDEIKVSTPRFLRLAREFHMPVPQSGEKCGSKNLTLFYITFKRNILYCITMVWIYFPGFVIP